MKYQKSPIPYLIMLFIMLIGLPLVDYKVNSDLVLEYQINLQKADTNRSNSASDTDPLITQALMLLPPNK